MDSLFKNTMAVVGIVLLALTLILCIGMSIKGFRDGVHGVMNVISTEEYEKDVLELENNILMLENGAIYNSEALREYQNQIANMQAKLNYYQDLNKVPMNMPNSYLEYVGESVYVSYYNTNSGYYSSIDSTRDKYGVLLGKDIFDGQMATFENSFQELKQAVINDINQVYLNLNDQYNLYMNQEMMSLWMNYRSYNFEPNATFTMKYQINGTTYNNRDDLLNNYLDYIDYRFEQRLEFELNADNKITSLTATCVVY